MLSRKTPLRRHTPLRSTSKKRSKQLRKYLELRRDYLTDHPLCEVCKTEPVGQIHHKYGRVGRHLLVVKDWIAICHTCHANIHQNGRWAREMKLL